MIQHAVGGVTQLASIVSCLILLVILLWIGPFFEALPRVCIAQELTLINLNFPHLVRFSKYHRSGSQGHAHEVHNDYELLATEQMGCFSVDRDIFYNGFCRHQYWFGRRRHRFIVQHFHSRLHTLRLFAWSCTQYRSVLGY